MKKLKLLIIFYVSSLICFSQYPPTQPVTIYTGILSQNFNFYAASQRQDQWCWAASIQMVFNYRGVFLSQEDIVRRTFGLDANGNLINRGASDIEITNALNAWGIDYNGRRFIVSAQYHPGIPIVPNLIAELNLASPIIIAYRSSPTTGHAIVLTGCSYVNTPNGPIIQTLIVRDPFPSTQNIQNLGRIEYPALDFIKSVKGFWIIRIN